MPDTGTAEAFITIGKAAAIVGVSSDWIHTAIERGELDAWRFGKRALFVKPSDVAQWVESKRLRSEP